MAASTTAAHRGPSATLPVSTVSQHLKILKAARLVTVHAVGTRRVYAVDTRGIESLRKWLDGFWDEALTAFKAAAEREAAKETPGRVTDRLEGNTKCRSRSLPK